MNNPFDLKGRVIVVTGAAGGLGTCMVKTLAALGADIAALDLREPAGTADIEAEYGVKCLPVACDITKDADVKNAVDAVVSKLGGIDALVNNAGMYAGLQMRPVPELDEGVWDKVFDVNVKGTWRITSACVPELRKRGGGAVVNISSSSILQGVPLLGHYVASKGAVWALTRTMANEFGEFSIRVNSITPGYTLTEASMTLAGTKEEFDANYNRNIEERALKRGMMPEDVSGAVAFLVSDASAFISGQNINVDGGSVHY